MKIKIFMLLLICLSCGKKELNSIVLPANQATETENETVARVLEKIQNDFDDLGVKVNIRSIPYHVTNLQANLAGICVTRDDGSPVGIAVSHDVLSKWAIEEDESYGFIYKVLLHEIGHCFFHRSHDAGIFQIPGFQMIILDDHHSVFREDFLELSAMKDAGKAMIIKSLWPYYVREIAGLDRIRSLDDVERYVGVELMKL